MQATVLAPSVSCVQIMFELNDLAFCSLSKALGLRLWRTEIWSCWSRNWWRTRREGKESLETSPNKLRRRLSKTVQRQDITTRKEPNAQHTPIDEAMLGHPGGQPPAQRPHRGINGRGGSDAAECHRHGSNTWSPVAPGRCVRPVTRLTRRLHRNEGIRLAGVSRHDFKAAHYSSGYVTVPTAAEINREVL